MNLDDLPARLAAKIEPEPMSGCWLWLGWLSAAGYGYQSVAGRDIPAHRVVYELLVAPIPAGLQIDHLCRNRACVSPWHLEVVTSRENTRRGLRYVPRTHCREGHPLEGDNLVTYAGERRCRICERTSGRIRQRLYRARKKR